MASPILSNETAAIGPWSPSEQNKTFRSVKSAERTLALFELFSLYQRPMSIGEIASALSIPQPSVTMLLNNLTALGYLERDRVERTFVPTVRIMMLGSWIHRKFSEHDALEQRLEELIAWVGETVLLGIQNGAYSQYVWVQTPRYPDRLEVQSGLLRPITRTATGRVLLSLKPDTEILALVRRCNADMDDPRLRVAPGEFMKIIERIRADGFARTFGDMTPGQSVIAVSLPPRVGKMPMVVAVGGPIERIEEKAALILSSLNRFRAALDGDNHDLAEPVPGP
jgi:DNA-binding IclR family transcriptional regulator